MESKFWLKSKLIWLSFIPIAVGIEPMITGFFNTGDYSSPKIVELIFGVALFVLRAFFTNKKIK